MGFLPIFIALLGLIILYSVFTYNQIKPKKAALTLVIDQMSEVSKTRKNLILSFDREHAGSPLSQSAQELIKTSTDRFQSFRKENELIEKTNEGAEGLDAANIDLTNEIKSLNQKQQENMKKLQSKADRYNAFIKKPPTNVVASLFGFRQF